MDDSKTAALKALKVLERHFRVHIFLVGEHVTLADLFTASQIARGFQHVLDREWRNENPNVTGWYERVTGQPVWKAVVDRPIMIEKAVEYAPSPRV